MTKRQLAQQGTINAEKSRTQQNNKDETDVNLIIAKAQRGLAVTHLNSRKGYYADVSQVPDYATALKTVADATDAFAALPAKLRARFDNNPALLLQFLGDPKNLDESYSLGLRDKPTQQTSTPINNQTNPNQTNQNLPPNQTQQTQNNNTQNQQK